MAYRDVVLALSPTSYWKLDEPSGTSFTDQVGGITGTSFSNPAPGQDPVVVNDYTTGKSIRLDSADADGIDFGSVYSFAGTVSFTVLVWAKLRTYSVSNGNWFFGRHDSNDLRGWLFRLENDGAGLLRVGTYRADGTAKDTAQDAGNHPISSWEGSTHMYALMYDGSNIKIAVDTAVTTTASSRSIAAPITNLNLTLGNITSAGGGGWDGWLDEAAVWSGTALSNAQITTLYNAGAADMDTFPGSAAIGQAQKARA